MSNNCNNCNKTGSALAPWLFQLPLQALQSLVSWQICGEGKASTEAPPISFQCEITSKVGPHFLLLLLILLICFVLRELRLTGFKSCILGFFACHCWLKPSCWSSHSLHSLHSTSVFRFLIAFSCYVLRIVDCCPFHLP